MAELKIKRCVVGMISTNCYIVYKAPQGEENPCIIIDPGDNASYLAKLCRDEKLKPEAILLTHGHFDHCTAVRDLLERWPDLPVYIHESDVTDRVSGGFDLLFPRLTEKNQRYYGEGDCLKLGGLTIRVLETPGHSRGSVCLVAGDVIFSGDTLFYGSCGRTDFAGGSYEDILRSLKRLAQLPGQYTVYPGHDRPTDLDFERRMNPYMKQGLRG